MAAFRLPEALSARYRDDRHVARVPFLLNDLVDDMRTLDEVSRQRIPKDGVFVGIAGFRSLDILANAGAMTGDHYQQAVLLDCNHTQIKAMHNIFKMIEQYERPQDFIKAFVPSYLKWVDHVPRSHDSNDPSKPHRHQTEEDRQYFGARGASNLSRDAEDVREQCEEMLYNPQSWLFPGNYSHIRQMVKAGQIETAVIHLNDPERMSALNESLCAQKLHVTDMYLSSALGSMHPSRFFDYYATPQAPEANPLDPIVKLMEPNTRIEVSHPHRHGGKNFELMIYEPQHLEMLREMHEAARRNPQEIPKHYGFVFGIGERTAVLASEKLGSQDFHYVFLENGNPDRDKANVEALNQAVQKLGFQVFPSMTMPEAVMMRAPHSHAFILPKERLEDPALYREISATLNRELASTFQAPKSPPQRLL